MLKIITFRDINLNQIIYCIKKEIIIKNNADIILYIIEWMVSTDNVFT